MQYYNYSITLKNGKTTWYSLMQSDELHGTSGWVIYLVLPSTPFSSKVNLLAVIVSYQISNFDRFYAFSQVYSKPKQAKYKLLQIDLINISLSSEGNSRSSLLQNQCAVSFKLLPITSIFISDNIHHYIRSLFVCLFFFSFWIFKFWENAQNLYKKVTYSDAFQTNLALIAYQSCLPQINM